MRTRPSHSRQQQQHPEPQRRQQEQHPQQQQKQQKQHQRQQRKPKEEVEQIELEIRQQSPPSPNPSPLSPSPTPPTPSQYPSRAKRPRVLTASTQNGQKTNTKTEKYPPPHTLLQLTTDPRPPNANQFCVFCKVPGSVPECEGVLLGPFKYVTKTTNKQTIFYAHRNCALWAPEVFENDQGQIVGVDVALGRARLRKCYLCGSRGGSLACNYKGNRCCRAVHFRCALHSKGSLQILPGLYRVLCESHGSFSFAPEHVYSYVDRTPVKESALRRGNACSRCDGDSYHYTSGFVLTCSKCASRVHTSCLAPDDYRTPSFLLNSFQNKHYCDKCMVCSHCDRKVDQRSYAIGRQRAVLKKRQDLDLSFDDDDNTEDYNIVVCSTCNHFAVHLDCLSHRQRKSSWRCDVCHVCRHCSKPVSRDFWKEEHEACPTCYKEIEKGAVICPVCRKLYRDSDGDPMIQCDGCDQWVHAENCAQLKDKFETFKDDKKKFFCPLCVDKKKKNSQRRRSSTKDATSAQQFLIGDRKLSNVESAVLEKISPPGLERAFYHIQPVGKDEDDLAASALSELAIDVDICRRCCSSSTLEKLHHCITCGNCYHDNCAKEIPGTSFSLDVFGQEVWQCATCRISWDAKEFVDTERRRQSAVIIVRDEHGKPKKRSVRQRPALPSTAGKQPIKACPSRQSRATITTNAVATATTAAVTPKPTAVARKPRLRWNDERTCELCERGEDSHNLEGRLIVWSSSMNTDLCDSWVHLGCILWSSNMSVHYYSEEIGRVVLGPRRAALNAAKRSRCVHCNGTGATIKCSAPGCNESYHFQCAETSGAGCLMVLTSNESNSNNNNSGSSRRKTKKSRNSNHNDHNVVVNEGGNLKSVRFVCRKHGLSEQGKNGSQFFSMHQAQQFVFPGGAIRVIDTQGYLMNPEALKKRVVSMNRTVRMRVGPLAVLRFGEVIPEVNDFIVDGCLVPFGYSVVLRFWSMKVVGKRCAYFMEVSGHAETGPRFVLRCSEDTSLKLEDEDLDKIWGIVWRKAMRIQLGRKMTDNHELCRSGLDMFGLDNCESIVRHIESLPFAAMFEGRYRAHNSNSWNLEPRNDDVPFYKSLAQKYVAPIVPKNQTGSARVEGYQRSSSFIPIKEKHIGKDGTMIVKGPKYENMRSGCDFQLQVAREIIFAWKTKDDMPDHHCVVISFQGRTRRASTALENGVVGFLTNENINGTNGPGSSSDMNDIVHIPEDSGDGSGIKRQSGRRRKRRKFSRDADVKRKEVEKVEKVEDEIIIINDDEVGNTNTARNNNNTISTEAVEKPRRYNKSEDVELVSGGAGGSAASKGLNSGAMAKARTRILRSEIDGWGVFATQDIQAGELIIEYVGEIIRPSVSDVREQQYLDMGIGCYMFEVVPGEIVDATMCGNAARFINHSCAPNCYSKTVWTHDKRRQVVAIFSKRRIQRGEELSYDYQFPYDDSDRVKCGCGAEQCKGFMN